MFIIDNQAYVASRAENRMPNVTCNLDFHQPNPPHWPLEGNGCRTVPSCCTQQASQGLNSNQSSAAYIHAAMYRCMWHKLKMCHQEQQKTTWKQSQPVTKCMTTSQAKGVRDNTLGNRLLRLMVDVADIL
jgi:hypothetical protein